MTRHRKRIALRHAAARIASGAAACSDGEGSIDGGHRARGHRPVTVAIGPVPPLGRVIDQAHLFEGLRHHRAVPPGLDTDRGVEVARAVGIRSPISTTEVTSSTLRHSLHVYRSAGKRQTSQGLDGQGWSRTRAGAGFPGGTAPVTGPTGRRQPRTWASRSAHCNAEGIAASACGDEVRGLVVGTNLALIERCCFA